MPHKTIAKRKVPFTIVEDHVLTNELITGSSKLVYVMLCQHADKEGKGYPSLARLAKLCSLSRPTVIKAIRSLVEHKKVSVDKTTGKSNIYWVGDQSTTDTGTSKNEAHELEPVNYKEEKEFDSKGFTNLWRKYAGMSSVVMAFEYKLAKEDIQEIGGIDQMKKVIARAFKRDIFPFSKGEPIAYKIVHSHLSSLLNAAEQVENREPSCPACGSKGGYASLGGGRFECNNCETVWRETV